MLPVVPELFLDQLYRNQESLRRVASLCIMATFLDHAYSVVHQDNTADQPTLQELKTQLEKGTDDTKLETMKRILTIMLNGDAMPQLLMHIIRFVMPSKSKPLKKLLYFYYEICPKLDAGGKLKQEMILVWYVEHWVAREPTLLRSTQQRHSK